MDDLEWSEGITLYPFQPGLKKNKGVVTYYSGYAPDIFNMKYRGNNSVENINTHTHTSKNLFLNMYGYIFSDRSGAKKVIEF